MIRCILIISLGLASLVSETQQTSEKIYFTRVSELGDIKLTEEQERQGIDMGKYPSYKWPNGIVKYTIAEEQFEPDTVIKIQNAIANFNDRSPKVKLVKKGRRDRDYVKVINDQGCYSYLGRIGGEQALSLQENGCTGQTTVQHEFMHAIGFTHEHNRQDRDNCVDVLWDNIPREWHSQYQKPSGDDFKDILDYECKSIMHYYWWAPNSGGKDAFRLKGCNCNDKHALGNGENNGATKMDIAKITELYS